MPSDCLVFLNSGYKSELDPLQLGNQLDTIVVMRVTRFGGDGRSRVTKPYVHTQFK